MSELVESVQGIFEKVSEVIDLSFFPPGAAALAAALYWNQTSHFFASPDGVGLGALPGWVQGTGAVLGSYVLGLLCFTFGRMLRSRVLARSSEAAQLDELSGALAAHGLDRARPFPADYLSRRAPRPLHARLWAEVREDKALRESYRLLVHYWVLAATYDGMATAFLVWGAVILHRGVAAPHGDVLASALVTLGLLAMVALSMREARRLQHAQIDELVATVAHARGRAGAAPADQGSS